ncbi:hypothetical protein Salat_2546200 [Sesamum alatum]|uniref:Uncharacterized protein n=1 Tax=Sesamum alatum TaxID=300844 RepID=A0AAE1XSL4_9LAMI|nr:hypothetical protein Salat_2546200 [Sesamum alatum]
MWPDGYYYQQQLFFFAKWSKEMEKTFTDNLAEHGRSELFHPRRPNIHVVMCSLYDVNKKGSDLEPTPRVLSPHQMRFGVLFAGPNNGGDDDLYADRFDLNVDAPNEGWVVLPRTRVIEAAVDEPANEVASDALTVDEPTIEVAPDALENKVVPVEPAHEAGPSQPVNEALHAEPVPTNAVPHPPMLYISDSSSSSMWMVLEEYHGSERNANSVLPLLGAVDGLSSDDEDLQLVGDGGDKGQQTNVVHRDSKGKQVEVVDLDSEGNETD